jgi:phosphatidylserine decarboxylase precursor
MTPQRTKDQTIVTELKELLNAPAHPDWQKLLLDSITEAKKVALDAEMKQANDWPDSLDDYYSYLNDAVQRVPSQDHAREMFVTLCTFYWLIDQPSGRKLQESDDFQQWMSAFAKAWGAFLDTRASAAHIDTFKADPSFNVWQYQEPPGGWLSFNQFFSRQTKPGLRPVAGMSSDGVVVNPADCTFKSKARITDDDKITFKHTHTYSVLELLKGSPYDDRFRGGLYMHSFLGPADYHHFRAPVRGTVLESRKITGRVVLDVVINDDGDFDAPDSAAGGYEFLQERGLIILDSPVGLVATLPIGMAQVSSVNMTAVEGSYLQKGEEFGFFAFGGSDIIMLFESGSGVEITAPPGVHFNACQAVGEVLDR